MECMKIILRGNPTVDQWTIIQMKKSKLFLEAVCFLKCKKHYSLTALMAPLTVYTWKTASD